MDFGSWEKGECGWMWVGGMSISTKEVIKFAIKLVILHNKTGIPLYIKRELKRIKKH